MSNFDTCKFKKTDIEIVSGGCCGNKQKKKVAACLHLNILNLTKDVCDVCEFYHRREESLVIHSEEELYELDAEL